MIPIRDTIRSKNYPIVNMSLIGVNAFVFLVQMAQGPGLQRFIYTYGLVPARYTVPEIASSFTLGEQAFALLSFMFLHGGFWHLLGNMWSLYIFGDNIEDRLGPFRYLAFYLLCGWVSGLFQLFANWHANIPTIGASGAIAGVMGAYLVLYPRSKILTLFPIFFFPLFLEIPAFFFLGFWFLLQFLSAAGSPAHGGGIAWWAHVGGFAFGLFLVNGFLKTPGIGATQRLRKATKRKTSPRLHVIRTSSSAEDSNLYGSIPITPNEARNGTRKVVNIPWGFQKRLVRITIPPGIRQGMRLRLEGLGRRLGQRRGDLLLEVVFQEEMRKVS